MDTSAPEMSASTRSTLTKVQRLIPPMLEKFHKGQLGRIAVIGGSQDYAGAPYFSAMASARLGCDMSHVICTPGAGAVIKTYSPNLMVHPIMRQSPDCGSPGQDSKDVEANPDKIAANVVEMFPRLHALVIGPGLGRDPLMQETVLRVIREARERGLPIVLDADALLVVMKEPSLMKGYKTAILTPNVVEFGRLCDSLKIDVPAEPPTERVETLARALDGPTVIQKGPKDYISNGSVTLEVDLEGGKKRSGGQGDTLTGALATFLGWRKAYHESLWESKDEPLTEEETIGLAAFGGCAIARGCSRLAFIKKGRSLQASDLTDEVHNSFMNLFGDVDSEGGSSRL
ncbi:ATP-dependent (S)-NAD(P)H-hydrate dehydratase [Paramyrothecium foliicola]|nr:ATP-dependent (S)-NAD(P)H-hydrate dehydratase [Paramyrothecium foliicola]